MSNQAPTLTTREGCQGKWDACIRANKNGYGRAVIEAVSAIGALLDNGDAPEAAVYAVPGLSFFQGACAVRMLVDLHPRGEDVREWWNKAHESESIPAATSKRGGE